VGPNRTDRRPPHFFVSYAHDLGEDDKHVRRFHADLSHDVRLHSGLRDEYIGFCDATLQAGDRWSPALVRALCTSQVFLALCSPTYFTRSSCGKEWQVFTRRLAGVGHPGPHLIPLFWVPMTMPDVAQQYQYRDIALGEAYRNDGLRNLIRLGANRDHYHRFITALATRIVNVVNQSQIPEYPHRPEFDAVEEAFPGIAEQHVPRQTQPAPRPDPSPWSTNASTEHEPGLPRLNPVRAPHPTPDASTVMKDEQ
jgi:hypothetical protein